MTAGGGERVPALDGVRGLAILFVLGAHAPTKPLDGGYVGVTLFFALSGYLITGLLLNEIRATGGVSFRSFYRRRVARLMPALVVVIAVTVVALAIGRRDLSAWQIAAPALAAIGYLTNIVLLTGHSFAAPDYFNYTWTLAIEEQFYLVWPLALYVGYRRWPVMFTAAVTGVLCSLLAVDVYLGLTRSASFERHEYVGSDTNAVPILAGALLAILLSRGWLPAALRRLATLLPAAIVGMLYLGWSDHVFRTSLVTGAASGLSFVILAAVLLRPAGVASRAFSHPVAVWFGQRSYSLYLWNILAQIAVLDSLGASIGSDILWLVAVLVAGELSFRLVERPARRKLAGRRPHPATVTVPA